MKQHTTDQADVEAWLDSLDVDPAKSRDATHVRRIAALATTLATVEADLTAAVIAARAAGDSWAMIGTALGVSRQAAFQRFGKVAS